MITMSNFLKTKGSCTLTSSRAYRYHVWDLTSEHFGFLEGTAMFLLAEVNKWVHTVDKAAWRAKKARRSEI